MAKGLDSLPLVAQPLMSEPKIDRSPSFRAGSGQAVPVALRVREKKHIPGLIPLRVPELRKLLSHLLWHTSRVVEHVLHWSMWRRKHQYRARQTYYRRREFSPPD